MSEFVVELTDAQLKDEIKSSDIPVMVDFWAQWCAPCIMMAPAVEFVAGEYRDRMKFAKVNVEDNRVAASELGVMNIPTFVFFKNGREVSRFSGVVSKSELTKQVEKIIGA